MKTEKEDAMSEFFAHGSPPGPHAAAGIVGTWERTAGGAFVLDADAAMTLFGDRSRAGVPMQAAEFAMRLGAEDRANLADALLHVGPGRLHHVAYVVVVDGIERRIVERGRFYGSVVDGSIHGTGVLLEVDEEDALRPSGDPTLEGLVEDCLDIRRRLGVLRETTYLQTVFDAILLEMGRELGRSLRRG
jgi:hypothetical protein